MLLGNLMIDAALNYEIDGVQLDDHFCCPIFFTYCNESVMNIAASFISSFFNH